MELKRWDKSYLDVAPNTISVLAIKQAEDSSDAMILRLQERSGKQTTAHVESSLLQLSHDVSFTPWELKTLRIESSKHAKAKCVKCRLSKPSVSVSGPN